MKKKIIISFSIIAVLVAAAILWINFSQKKITVKFASLEEVIAKAPEALKDTYDNLKLPDSLYACTADTLYTYTEDPSLEGVDAERGTAAELFSSITGLEISGDDFEADDGDQLNFYRDDDEKNPEHWFGAYGYGGCFDITTRAAMYERSNFQRTIKYYYIKRGETPEGSYDICGEDYSMEDAIAFAEKYLEDINITKYLREGYSLEPSIIEVKATKGRENYESDPTLPAENLNYYVIYFDIICDGVPLCDSGYLSVNSDYFETAAFFMQIDAKDHVGCLRNIGQPIVTARNDIEKDKFATLESCLKVTSNYLAAESNYEVKEIGIRYCTLANEANGNAARERRPYWRIVLSGSLGGDITPVLDRCVYIDMQTGTLYLYDDKTCEMLGEKENEA